MAILVDKLVTAWAAAGLLAMAAQCQTAASLKEIHRIYVGSLGSYPGAEELKRQLVHDLGRSGQFALVTGPGQADAVIDGRAELWIRGYHSLSPRARINQSYAEPIMDGYLSIKVHGKEDEILWSYFADPKRVSFHELKHDLVDEVLTQLNQARHLEASTVAASMNANDTPVALHGGGATFPVPLYQQWFQSFHHQHPAWTFEYASTGSDAGLTGLAAGTIDFAGSDIPPSSLGGRLPPDAHAFPAAGGAVVLIYNLPGFTGELHLTPDLISSIFSGRIKMWNDPAMQAVNRMAPLPEQPIATFHRADGSGTTYAFSEYLSKVDNQWKTSYGTGAHIAWVGGAGVNGNGELAQMVGQTPFSLGYVEFIYAFDHHLSFAAVRNLAGRFVQPDLLSIMAAANGSGEKEEYLSLSITNSSATNAYPISTFTWLVAAGSLNSMKQAAFKAFIGWMLTSGQRQCSALGYAPLPKNLADRELAVVAKLK